MRTIIRIIIRSKRRFVNLSNVKTLGIRSVLIVIRLKCILTDYIVTYRPGGKRNIKR